MRQVDWQYTVKVAGPNGKDYSFRNVSSSKVAHLRYCVDKKKPWRGSPPLQKAGYAAKLLANLERSLGWEANTRVGYLLPIPKDGEDETIEKLTAQLKNLCGNVALLETTAEAWGSGAVAAPKQDYDAKRLGANPPQVLVQLYELATRQVLAVLGVPVELVSLADGTGKREAWRQFLWSSVAPLARKIEAELSKLASGRIALNFDELNASDIVGRARAFQSLVGGGMDIDEAANISGLVATDE